MTILSSYTSCSDNYVKGGKGKMHLLFGEQMNEIISELNEVLAA